MQSLARLFRSAERPPIGSSDANNAVRERLASYGDDGAAMRHVLHYAYPNGPSGLDVRQMVIDHMKSRGFEVSDAKMNDGVVLEHYRSVTADSFDKLTEELSTWFAARGWEYDGWECAVIEPPEAQNPFTAH